MHYTLPQWILFFFIYCFFGWCIESAIVSVETKKLTNRGFLRGPVLPIYGFGAIAILHSTLPFEGNLFMEYLVGTLVCTVLEYFAGVLMEAIFKTRYWDYSGRFMNFQGQICLRSSLFWGVLSLVLIHVVHEPISKLLLHYIHPGFVLSLDIILSALFFADLYFSAKAAFKLSKIVQALDEINVQLELAKIEARDAIDDRIEELEDRLDELSGDLRRRVEELRARREEVLKTAGAAVRSLIKNNPSARHRRFAKGFDTLRDYVHRVR